MRTLTSIKSRLHGFTLVEIAMVLLIVTLLLGGLIPTISSQIEQRHVADTRKQMDEIQQALIGYAIANGNLPCPAKATLVTGVDANAGQADCTLIAATTTTGVIPWATLGTSETDSWGRRFTYTATNSFITTTPTFTLASIGNLNVMTAAAGGTSVASNTPAVIVSHGTNGCGAYTPKGTQISPSNSLDEKNNSGGGLVPFVSRDPTSSSDCTLTTTYDDLVVWVSPNILFNRMVAAGKLP